MRYTINKLKLTFCLLTLFLTCGCMETLSPKPQMPPPEIPKAWQAYLTTAQNVDSTEVLKGWWSNFNDPTLNALINNAMQSSPDRLSAKARVLEARGLRRGARSALFPQISLNAQGGRQDIGIADPDTFYNASFDASYELDLFEKNRNANTAANKVVKSFEEDYNDITITLIGDIVREYIDHKTFKQQQRIAEDNLKIQNQILELVKYRKKYGEAPQLDVELAENLVNTTRANISEFERLTIGAQLRLSILTGKMPSAISKIIGQNNTTLDVLSYSLEPILMAPADVLQNRPDVKSARNSLMAASSLAESVVAELYPNITLGTLFGITKGGFVNGRETIWNALAGVAMPLIDFGKVEGRIDSARAVETQAYQQYRKSIITAITDVETAAADYIYINKQYVDLQNAHENANNAFRISKLLYREGEVSFINVLKAQENLNRSDERLLQIKSGRMQAVVRMYKALGIY